MKNAYDTLVERGFIEQTTHEEEIRELLEKESVTFYTGFDPTADSLHLGHFVQIMVMMHMQQAGHKPVALIGGGTAMVGDPSGKTEMRKMLTEEDIDKNAESLKNQISKYLDLDGEKGYAINNKEWLKGLNYIDFIRDIGKHFSVNRMLTAECFKSRMEKGLSFLEFNYMLMQSYDFLELHKRYNCKLELGGNDQWSNILSGADLVRRVESESAYGLTFKLLTTSEGKKMGKTESGAIWVDPNKTPPFEMYQYLRNIDDTNVENTLALLTFLPMDEVKRLGSLEGAEINKAKEILAFEFTKIVHGEEEAIKAQKAAKALFSDGADMSNIPSTDMDKSIFEKGIGLLDLMTDLGLTSSNGEARRLVKQGGVSVNDEKITDFKKEITSDDFEDGKLMIRKGKKKYHQVKI
ncbi:tyrosine--tRNA ligase [Clostridium sp. D2Q-14]|uniref:tyrosine--tRNA ligase n=1 Tax=Anaeromonas gelatinilytica TaxID=2683194 RepID=UPI00193B9C22|nr:tyrosine--tRNA ligase [Anaeromonas gelatinilytica]MBS4536358.1 tyrosine--tRNA ligase [Anaeromonas gelatinilytica]